MGDLFLGIDLGGTNIKAGVTDERGKILGDASIPTTQGGAGVEAVVGNMVKAARAALEKAGKKVEEVAAVGVDSPGAVDVERGMVIGAPNLAEFVNVPLRKLVQDQLGRPTVIENDAKAAAFGEYWAGAGRAQDTIAREGEGKRRLQSMLMITLGTGVGGGIILGGKVYHGVDNVAGEIGHMVVETGGEICPCGQRGCLERYASASRTGTRAAEMLSTTTKDSSLREVVKKSGHVTSADVVAHAQAGDALAMEVWEQTCRYLAVACVNLLHILDPEMIVLGGGMAKAGEFLRGRVEGHLQRMYWNVTPVKAVVALAELGNDMGVVGAAGLAREFTMATPK